MMEFGLGEVKLELLLDLLVLVFLADLGNWVVRGTLVVLENQEILENQVDLESLAAMVKMMVSGSPILVSQEIPFLSNLAADMADTAYIHLVDSNDHSFCFALFIICNYRGD